MQRDKVLIEQAVHGHLKELNCLYNVTSAILDQEKSIEKIFHAIVDCLPPAWQYSDISCARIMFEDKEYVSAGFRKSKWKQSADIFSEGEKAGTVEVYYLKKMPVRDEGPFLRKERMLIDAVANYLSNAYKRIELEDFLKERIKELDCFYGVSNVIEKHNSDYKKILQGIVDLLPDAWKHSEKACAKIVFKNEEFKTDNYKDSPWKQSADIKIGRQTIGFIEVVYTIEMSALDEGPFLKEERLLINAVSERISNAIKRIRTEEELRIERISLENKNIALKEVIGRIQEEKNEIARSVQANVDKIIIPIFSILENNADFKDTKILEFLKKNLQEVTSPFTNAISNRFMALSPVEIQICGYVKNGFSTKEIAQLRGVAIATICRHREHIREKLQLVNKNINLVTYLNNFMSEK
jgi:DNA-binding CsgD family transcriptional regulator